MEEKQNKLEEFHKIMLESELQHDHEYFNRPTTYKWDQEKVPLHDLTNMQIVDVFRSLRCYTTSRAPMTLLECHLTLEVIKRKNAVPCQWTEEMNKIIDLEGTFIQHQYCKGCCCKRKQDLE